MERLQNKISLGGRSSSHQPEREVLLKEIAQAIPNHYMSLFRLPKVTIQALVQEMAKF
ncbi:hypothetical protein Syun_009304 [Stephania yunnanensis]|uniref:Uncharacterized protein n=1 Tax=Stephania yunnanensis TaxID=152371 RepID=A0AAP0KFB5_9MAGN